MPHVDPEKRREQNRRYYAMNREQQYARNVARRQQVRAFVDSLKHGKKCLRCPEDHPACLHFHHRDPSEKEMDIADVTARGWSDERILDEVGKCDLLCANCHLKLHWNERMGFKHCGDASGS